MIAGILWSPQPAKQALSIKPGASAPGPAASSSLARETGDISYCRAFARYRGLKLICICPWG
jgi:hypothetical protein